MDTYENTPFEPHQEPAPVPTPQEPVQNKGKKDSPFADSPYMAYGTYSNTNPETNQNTSYAAYEAPATPPKKKPRSGKGLKAVLVVVLVACLLGGSIVGTAAVVNNHWSQENAEMEAKFSQQLLDLQQQLSAMKNAGSNTDSGIAPVTTTSGTLLPKQVYAQNIQSVVMIKSQIVSNSFGQTTTGTSSGSGFILTEDGYVVTNYHVVEGASSLSVITSDGESYPATLIGREQNNDVALLKIEATGLDAVTLGSSDELIVGDMVVAIGNPLGELTSTLTVGYVSAKERDVTTDGTVINMLQTDAAINSGNSGGPLFNMKGEVVGITTAKYSGTSNSGASIEGIGFAIPIDDVASMISDLKEYGYVTGAYLGVMVRTMDEDTASMYGLPMGSYVDSVEPGSCAEKAGLQPKDIIIALGDQEVVGNTSLTRALRKYKAGDTATLTVYRSGKEVQLTITFDEKPAATNSEAETPDNSDSQLPSNGSYEEWYKYFFGNGNNFFGNGNG